MRKANYSPSMGNDGYEGFSKDVADLLTKSKFLEEVNFSCKGLYMIVYVNSRSSHELVCILNF